MVFAVSDLVNASELKGNFFMWNDLKEVLSDFLSKQSEENRNSITAVFGYIVILFFFFLVMIKDGHKTSNEIKNTFLFVASFGCIFPAICFFCDMVKIVIKKKEKLFKTIVLFLIFALGASPAILLYCGYGNTQIGSFWEKENYTEVYMVRAADDGKNSEFRTQWLYPADVHKSDGCYYIECVYLEDNEKIYFDDMNEIFLDKEVGIYDVDDEYIYIRLTDEKYKN